MKLLIVDRTTEGQAQLVKRVEEIEASDREALNLTVGLAGENNFQERLHGVDVLILGPELGEDARHIARRTKDAHPEIQILIYVTDQAYFSGAFRVLHLVRIRKVIPQSAPALDLLQELVTINEEFRASGRVSSGKLIVFTQAKGGVGATSIVAALGELCEQRGAKTILWDFDIETRDLCRALTANGIHGKIVTSWVEGTREINRESLQDALLPIGEHTSVLMPPDLLPAAMDLAGHPDGVELANRIVNLARVSHDNIIVDLSGRFGPAAGALMRSADAIVVVIDDSMLGMSAVPCFVGALRKLVRTFDTVHFLCSGTTLTVDQIARTVQSDYQSGEAAWRLPAIPADPCAPRWPGSGKTLWSLGKRQTQAAIEALAAAVGLVTPPRQAGRKPQITGTDGEWGERRSAVGAPSFFQRIANFSFGT